MYHIKFYEDYRFVTEIGGPVATLAEAIAQIDKLSETFGAEALDDLTGCQWNRRSGTPCCLVVFGEWGAIKKEDFE